MFKKVANCNAVDGIENHAEDDSRNDRWPLRDSAVTYKLL